MAGMKVNKTDQGKLPVYRSSSICWGERCGLWTADFEKNRSEAAHCTSGPGSFLWLWSRGSCLTRSTRNGVVTGW